MTTVRVRCDACKADLQLSTEDLRLVVCSHGAQVTCYCSTCGEWVSQPASPASISLLRAAHVREIVVVPEPGAHGPPITEDDLIAFGLALEAT